MRQRGASAWYEGDLYELLCLMMTGACLWLVGKQLNLFSVMSELAVGNGLGDVIMLGVCTSFGLYAAALRKSYKLRGAVTARDRAQSEADAVARHDALTGLPNRRFLMDLLQARLSDAERSKSVALLLIDLDRFKTVNDIHGHAAGDAVLCAVADRLRALMPSTGIAARLAGDEFAVVVDFGSDLDSVARLCHRVIVDLSRPVLWAESLLEVGATIGVATTSGETIDAEALLHAADVAIHDGKKDGRGSSRFFRQEMDQSLRARAQLEQELRRGIDSGQIEPFFQPLVALSDKQLIGFEVLARWRHPTRGLVVPDEFISVAEETGMIDDLCWSVLRQACLHARSWPAYLQLAINISPKQLQDRHLPERLLGILTETGFAPGRLEVEITETALVADLEAARSALKALRNLGIRIALDDFGTGYSSLLHLRELKFDKLKIDRSYITSVSQGDEGAKLVNAIVALATSLGMVTTAEGIETRDSLGWLAEQGCTYGQGYFFGRPMPRGAIDHLFDDRDTVSFASPVKGLAA